MEGLSGFNRKILILGDMLELGLQERDFHLKIGEQISKDKIDKLFTFGPLAEHIAIGARKTFKEDHVQSFQNKQNLIDELKKQIEPNDLLLVKGVKRNASRRSCASTTKVNDKRGEEDLEGTTKCLHGGVVSGGASSAFNYHNVDESIQSMIAYNKREGLFIVNTL